MTDALRAEWTKFRTVPGSAWTVAAAIVVTVALGAVAVAVTTASSATVADPTKLTLTGIELGQVVLAVLAVTVIAGEYATGVIGITLTAVPRRSTVLGAKAIVVGGVSLAASGLAVAGSLVAGWVLLADGARPSIADGPTARALAGSVVYLTLVSLMGLGIATAVRDAASAVGIVFAALYLFPILAGVVNDPVWEQRIRRLAPRTAGQAIQTTVGAADLPIGPWAGLAVVTGWAIAALAIGAVVLEHRDA